MPQHTIYLFMWGYQPHFRIALQTLAKDVFKALGIDTDLEVLLVGARIPQRDNPNAVCVEPEDREWSLELFDGLLDAIEVNVKDHQLQNVFYGDAPSNQDKPEVIRRDSVSKAVGQALSQWDSDHDVGSFCGGAYPVGDYYVVPVIQIPRLIFRQFPPLSDLPQKSPDSWQGPRSLIHAALATLLAEATEELSLPDPGRTIRGSMRGADEIVRKAASAFMQTPGAAIQRGYFYTDLFERFNLISTLMYEGARGIGHVVLVDPSKESIDWILRFKEPVPFWQPRWTRKVLQMAADDVALIANTEMIYGLGRLNADHDATTQDAFTIDFLDHYHWELRCGPQVLLRSRYGLPKLPQEHTDRDRFATNYERIFPETTPAERDHMWALFTVAISQAHGSMIVVAEDAADEAQRLSKQGTGIEPVRLTEDTLKRVSRIDGTILLDPHGVCYAVGVILDGAATPDCTPSRGSRFNSGLRYVSADGIRRLAIIVSDDHTVDIIPLLRPQLSRRAIEQKISALEAATLENYHRPRSWLDSHRFYLDATQCAQVNTALDRIESLPKDVGELVIITNRFEVNPEMDDDYLLP